ncbi:Tyrosine decarboxylase [Linum perenne]
MLIDFIADYYKQIEQYPVLSQVKPGYLANLLPQSPPYDPEPIEDIINDVKTHIIPGITHWQHPSHFAYFPSSGSTAGFLGELLSAGGGGGVIMGTTCEALLATLVAARDEKTSTRNDVDQIGKLVVYCSDQTHCAFQKAAKIVGIHPGNIRVISTKKTASFELCPRHLESAIHADLDKGLVPFFLCATVGTTSTTTVDPLTSLCDVAKKDGLWVHVDAAYAGSACICPEFRHFINGVEGADSFSLNAHKWLLATLDCCCLWLKDTNALKKSLSTNPDYRNLRKIIRSHVTMAKTFEELVAKDERFEVVVPRHFAMVCFRMLPQGPSSSDSQVASEMKNKKLLKSINESGRVFMTSAVAGGMFMIRFAVGATLTETRHVLAAWKVVQLHADAMEGSVAMLSNGSKNGVIY